MIRKGIALFSAAALVCSLWGMPLSAAAGETGQADNDTKTVSDTLAVLTEMTAVCAQEKTIDFGDTDAQELAETLGVTQLRALRALQDETSAAELFELYGYEAAEDGSYQTQYASMRLLVDGEAEDDDAILSVEVNGITLLQYDSPEEAALAAHAIAADGMDVIPDTELAVEAYGTYESDYMNLECNAEGDTDVVVAVIDTGANVEYLDSERILTGYNVADDSTDVTDNYGHGTMTASVVLSNTGSNVSILPIKMIDTEDSSTSYADILETFEYALEQEVDIVSMSLGIEVDNSREGRETIVQLERYLGTTIDALTDSGTTFVVAAGNSAASSEYVFPACHDSCWTISSIGESYERSYFSNYGNIDFCAPGEDVTVTTYEGESTTASGTSFSAPLIAAAAAQLAGNGMDTDSERYAYMQTICLDLGTSGYDRYYGYGLPQMEHNYKIETTDATCQVAGTTVYTCDCGETYTVTDALIDHIEGDPVITETDDGGQVWSYYCTMCGELVREVTYTAEELYGSDTAEDSQTTDTSDSDILSGLTGSDGSEGSDGSQSTQNTGGSSSAGSANTTQTDTSDYTVPTSMTAAGAVSLTGATTAQVTQTLAMVKDDGDFKDSTFVKMRARASKVTKTSVKLSWTHVSGAASYVIYAARCGSSKYKQIKTVTGTSLTVKKIAGTKLKKARYYKFIVTALDENGKVIQTSKTVHAATKGGKKTNAKSVALYKGSVKVTSVSLTAGSSVKLKGRVVKQKSSGKISTHRKVQYESSDTSVATVNANGKIKAKKKGTCYVYAYAQNGIFTRVKVTVK